MIDFEIGDIVSIKKRDQDQRPLTHYGGDRGMIIEISQEGILFVNLWLCRKVVRFSNKEITLVQKLEEV